jgi:putative Mn2+ efflux pump MntP
MDALGIGFGLALMGQGLFTAATIIGIMAASMTYAAMKLGNTLSHRFGSRMEALGGIILLGIAVKLVVD